MTTVLPVHSPCSVIHGVQHACDGGAVEQGVGAKRRDPRGFCTWGRSAPASRLPAVQWRTWHLVSRKRREKKRREEKRREEKRREEKRREEKRREEKEKRREEKRREEKRREEKRREEKRREEKRREEKRREEKRREEKRRIEKNRKEQKRKGKTTPQFNERPSIILGCPGFGV